MSRNKIVALLSIVCLAAFVFWFQSRGSKDDTKVEAPSTSETVDTQMSRPSAAGDTKGKGGGQPEVSFADDPEGSLRLEGQVLTKDDLPVAGAIVSIDSRPPRFTTSEEDGSFAFDKLVGKSYDLVARATEGVAGPIRAQLSESNEPVIMVLSEGGKVTVQVVSAGKAEALSGALVELRGIDIQTATTDDEGNAVFQQVPVDRYSVVAKADGFAMGRTRLAISRSGASATARLELKGGARVAGIVVDPDGKPLKGARVVYRGLSDRSVRANGRLDGVDSDKEGRFAFPALPSGSFVFTATAEGYAPGSSDSVKLTGTSETTGVEVRMEPGATLRGVVSDTSGAPVASARVRVSVQSEGMRRRRRGGVRQVFTDDKGEYELTGLPRKNHDVMAVHDNASSEIQAAELSVDPHEVTLDITLDVDGVVAGIVVDTNDEPLAGAQVTLFPDFRKGVRRSSSEWRLRGMSTALTDSGGRFEIGGLKPGEDYRVRATPATSTSQGRGWLTEGVEAKTGDTEVKIVLPADGGIKGKVAFGDGAVPSLFTVSVGWQRGTPFSTKDGSFELGELPPQKFTATIQGPDFDPRRMEVEVEEGKVADLGTVMVSQGRRVVGRVVDSNGSPVEGAMVSAGRVVVGDGTGTSDGQGRRGNPLARDTKRATTDENGDFAISGIGLGDMSIVADHETLGRSVPHTVQMSNESITALSLQILKTGSLEGSVRKAGQPQADVFVSASSVSAPSVVFSVSTGPEGTYRLDRLAPDSYRVKAMAGGNPMQGMSFYSALVEVLPDTQAKLDIDLESGPTTLNVALSSDQELGFSRLSILAGAVKAATARELEAIVGAGAGFEGMGMSIRGQPARAKGLSSGRYTVCATVYPPQVSGMGGVMDYMKREGDNLAVQCQSVVIGEEPEQSITMKVEVPEFVPDPNGEEAGETGPG